MPPDEFAGNQGLDSLKDPQEDRHPGWAIAEKRCLITGATSGIGKETALALAKHGAAVVIHGRDEEKCERTLGEIRSAAKHAALDYLIADLSSQAEIHELALEFQRRYTRLDILINNAGGFFINRRESMDGHELTFAVNHLAHFSLTLLLLEQITASPCARIINVSSEAHRSAHLDLDDIQSEHKYGGYRVYAKSKLANVLFNHALSRRLGVNQVTVNALHPGLVATSIGSDNWIMNLAHPAMKLFMASPEKGARTSVYLAASNQVSGITGKYFIDCRAVPSSPESNDPELSAALWQISLELTGLEGIL